MAVKKFYSTKAKAGWKFDQTKKKYWSYGFDIYLSDGKRKRESGFATEDLAQAAAARIKLGEKNKKYELTDTRKFPTVAELFQKRIDNLSERGEKVRSQRVLQTILDLLDKRDLSHLRIDELTTNHIDLYTKPDNKDASKRKRLTAICARFAQP